MTRASGVPERSDAPPVIETSVDTAYLRAVFEWDGGHPSVGLVVRVLQELRDIGEVALDVHRARDVFANPLPDGSQLLPRVVRMTLDSRLEVVLGLRGDWMSIAALVAMIEWVFAVDVRPMTTGRDLSPDIEKARRECPRLLHEYSRIRRRTLPLTPYADLRVTEAELVDAVD